MVSTKAPTPGNAGDVSEDALTLRRDGIVGKKAAFTRDWVEQLREDMMTAFWEAIQRPGGAVGRGPRRWRSSYAGQHHEVARKRDGTPECVLLRWAGRAPFDETHNHAARHSDQTMIGERAGEHQRPSLSEASGTNRNAISETVVIRPPTCGRQGEPLMTGDENPPASGQRHPCRRRGESDCGGGEGMGPGCLAQKSRSDARRQRRCKIAGQKARDRAVSPSPQAIVGGAPQFVNHLRDHHGGCHPHPTGEFLAECHPVVDGMPATLPCVTQQDHPCNPADGERPPFRMGPNEVPKPGRGFGDEREVGTQEK